MIIKTEDVIRDIFKEIEAVSRELSKETDLDRRKVWIGKRGGLTAAIEIIKRLELF